MPGFMPGIHVFRPRKSQDVDGRDEPGHDRVEGVHFKTPFIPAQAGIQSFD
jgi:hypothetical protein